MLTPVRFAQFCAVGLVLWFAGAMSVRYGGQWLAGDWALPIYAATFPGVWLMVVAVRRLLGAGAAEMVPGIAAGSAAATFCDGLALRWFDGLYGPFAAQGAAWILWGASAFLVAAFIEERRS